jgi:hypothetical protein
MIELHPRLFVGDQSTCLGGFDGLAKPRQSFRDIYG